MAGKYFAGNNLKKKNIYFIFLYFFNWDGRNKQR